MKKKKEKQIDTGKDAKKMPRKWKVIHVICLLLVSFAAIAALLSSWVLRTWQNLTMDELMYQLSAPTEGTGGGIIESAIIQAGIPSAAIIIFFWQLFRHTRRKGFYKKLLIICLVSSVAVLSITDVYVWNILAIGDYLNYQTHPSTFIEDNYVDPDSVSITFPQKKRNLVFIYLESMEVTYSDLADGGGFEDDVIPELTQIAESNEDFSGSQSILNGAYALPYTTFTMGAMFGMTSGLPLKNNLENNDMITQSKFFANTTCLGDILENEGYHNVFMLGSNASFGGRRLYFEEHGNYDIIDYNYALNTGMIPKGYKVWWGFEDSKLFSFAQDELTALSQVDEPFALTLLTVDTHFENGYAEPGIPTPFGDNQYANVMAYSSYQVSQFLSWMQEQPWYDNTTVIICGDHPTMDSDFCDDVDSSYQRRAYVAYINSAVSADHTEYRTYSTLDAFPTTLAALGATIEGDRLGLGTNLFSDTPTLLEEYGLKDVTEQIERKSTFMEKLADIDFSSESLKERQSWSRTEDHGTTVYDTN